MGCCIPPHSFFHIKVAALTEAIPIVFSVEYSCLLVDKRNPCSCLSICKSSLHKINLLARLMQTNTWSMDLLPSLS